MSYFYKIVFLTSVFVAVTYLFILSVDPYDKEGVDLWDIGAKAVSSAREYKFTHLDSGRNNYKAFIIGSSRVLRMDPELVEKLTGLRSYNYGVENANAEDLLAETKHIIDKQHPEMILLFVDFFMMNGYVGTDKRLIQSRLSKYLDEKTIDEKETFNIPFFHRSYLTIRALKDSINLFLFKGEEEGSSLYLKNGQHIKEVPQEEPKLAIEYFDNQYKSFRKDDLRLIMLSKIKDLCQNNNVKLIVSQTPMSTAHLQKILENQELAKMFFTLKRELVKIFGSFHDFNNFSVTPYEERKYWYDSVHPSEILADIIINRILNPETQGDFGKEINESEIDEYLKSF